MKYKYIKISCGQYEHPKNIWNRLKGHEKYDLISYRHKPLNGYAVLKIAPRKDD